MRRKFLFLIGLAVLLAAPPLFAAKYKADVPHVMMSFRVTHMAIQKVNGSFSDFDASLQYDPDDLSTFSLTATIQVASIDTNNDARDNHLRSSDFFDAENHPTITFESTSLSKMGDGWVVHGDLTIRGVTKQIELPVQIVGPMALGANTVVAIAGSVTVNRLDYGVAWNRTADAGRLIVSKEVDLEVGGEFIQESM